jgi:hypothetical protein
MSIELKACPFCGSEAEKCTKPLGVVSLPAYHCSNENCPADVVIASTSYELAAIDWNTRPIEDALEVNADLLAACNAAIEHMIHNERSEAEYRAAEEGNADNWEDFMPTAYDLLKAAKQKAEPQP